MELNEPDIALALLIVVAVIFLLSVLLARVLEKAQDWAFDVEDSLQ